MESNSYSAAGEEIHTRGKNIPTAEYQLVMQK